jgi:hypothetical protein
MGYATYPPGKAKAKAPSYLPVAQTTGKTADIEGATDCYMTAIPLFKPKLL